MILAINKAMWLEIGTGFWQTLYMTLISTLIAYVIGIPVGVILNIILNKITNFKLSHIITIYISILTIIFLLIKNKNMVLYIIIFFILLKIIKEYRDHKYIFNKFLFERYNYDLNFKKKKTIKGIKVNKMKKEYKHIFYDNKYYTEKEILKRYFKR